MADTANFFITADSAGFNDATQSIQKLEQAAARLDAKLADLEKHLLAVANAAKVAGNTHIGNMTTFGHAMNARFDNDPNNLPPNVQQAHQAYTQAQQQQDSQDQRQNQQSANQKAKQGAPSADGGGGDSGASQFVKGQAKNQEDRSFIMRMAETLGRTRTANSLGAFASGNGGPLATTVAQAVMRAMTDGHTVGGIYQSGLSRLQAGAFRALAGSGAADLEAGGVPALAAVGGRGVAMGGMAAGSMGAAAAAAAPALIPAIIAASLGAILMGMNSTASKQITAEQGFRANITGTEGYKAQGLRGRLEDIAVDYNYKRDQVFGVADQMGRAGVGGSQIQDATKITLAMSRLTGMDPSQTGQLTSTMMVQGGKSVDQVKDAFLNLRDAAQKGGVSLTKMIDSISTLQQATGGAAVNFASLASLQSALGPGINAGQLASPLVGSFGIQSIVQSSLLHVPMGKFMAMQQQPMALMQAVAGFSHGMFGGQNTPMNQEILGTILNSTGLINTQGMNPQQQQHLVSALIKGDVRDVQKIQGQAVVSETKNSESAKTFGQQMQSLSRGETSWQDMVLNELDRIWQKLNDIARAIPDLGKILSSFGSSLVQAFAPLQVLVGVAGLIQALAEHFKITAKGGKGGGPGALLGVAQIGAGVVTGDPGMVWSGIQDVLGSGAKSGPNGSQFKIGRDKGGIWVPTTHAGGGTAFASHAELGYMASASKASGIPLSLLLAIGARESEFRNAPGGGVGQVSPIALLALTQAHIKGNPFYGKSMAQMNGMVNDPRQNAMMEAFYLSLVSKRRGGTMDPETLATGYNGSSAYGSAIQGSEVVISGELRVTDSNGKQIGTAKAQSKARMTTHPSHNPHRQPRGQSPHRAQQPPPRPAPPTGL